MILPEVMTFLSMNKRIACIIENLGSGGAERQISGLAVLLHKQGYEVEVWYYIDSVFYLAFLQENGVTVRFLADASNYRHRFSVLRKQIARYKPHDVISYSVSPSVISCLLKAFGAKFNLIVSERNTTQTLTGRDRLRFFLYRWANVIVPNSNSQASFIKQHFPYLSSKITVITNFVDTEVFSPAKTRIPSRDIINVVCVGGLAPQKNILRLMQAIGQVKADGYSIRIDWFGRDFGDSYSCEIHRLVSDLSLEDNVVFHRTSNSIQTEYCNADVFCLPSLYEGFPNVLCEAMSCGLPVLCSRVCDNPSIVNDTENGYLFDPLSIGDMVNTIEKFLNLPSRQREEMGRKSREIAVVLFSKERFLNQYIQLLS